ncbi:MAG: gliding motility-associated protein GldE [Marinilabiliaceae bacterium]|nr:gliding motility-associated protein GldE [Marinilabiliaceae bacterium]
MSGSEVAYFSLKPSDIDILKKEKGKNNQLILKHLDEPEWLLATILIGNNFVNVGVVILAAFVSGSVIDFGQANTLRFVFETILITSGLLFFGEILPKVYATRHPRSFAAFMAFPLLAINKIFHPISYLLIASTNIVNQRLTRKAKSLSMDELSQALELTANELTDEKEILEGIVKFGNIDVQEIMTPRVDVIDINIESDFKKVQAVIVESGYSRIPVYEDTPDNVKGILYVKDLLLHLDQDASFEWQKVIRPPYYVPETKKINDLLSEFKKRKIHMAVVVDEYGGTAGIVTLEDILEEIVGDISDEMDEDETPYVQMPDGSLIFEGKTLLNDFHKVTDTDESEFEPVRGDAETLAGLLLEIKGEIPKKNETIEFNNCTFTVVAADNRRIKKVKFMQHKPIQPTANHKTK